MRRFASGFSLVRCPPAERQITRSKLFGGLVAAHDKGVLHRDLKPENIFLTSDGRIENDFGVAKLRRPEGDFASVDAPTVASQIGAGVVLGAVAYMSPEQIRGKPADTRSDLFCVGAILYEMVSGKRAFRGDTAADAMSAIGCEQDGGLDLAKFIHLGRTSQLAEGVANENRARHLFAEQIAGMRQDGCHASAHSSPRVMVVCPTSTPATSVIASSGPVGRMPTLSPKSEARGRALELVSCATGAAVASKTTTAARIFSVM